MHLQSGTTESWWCVCSCAQPRGSHSPELTQFKLQSSFPSYKSRYSPLQSDSSKPACSQPSTTDKHSSSSSLSPRPDAQAGHSLLCHALCSSKGWTTAPLVPSEGDSCPKLKPWPQLAAPVTAVEIFVPQERDPASASLHAL